MFQILLPRGICSVATVNISESRMRSHRTTSFFQKVCASAYWHKVHDRRAYKLRKSFIDTVSLTPEMIKRSYFNMKWYFYTGEVFRICNLFRIGLNWVGLAGKRMFLKGAKILLASHKSEKLHAWNRVQWFLSIWFLTSLPLEAKNVSAVLGDFFNIFTRMKPLTNSYFKINIALEAAYL